MLENDPHFWDLEFDDDEPVVEPSGSLHYLSVAMMTLKISRALLECSTAPNKQDLSKKRLESQNQAVNSTTRTPSAKEPILLSNGNYVYLTLTYVFMIGQLIQFYLGVIILVRRRVNADICGASLIQCSTTWL